VARKRGLQVLCCALRKRTEEKAESQGKEDKREGNIGRKEKEGKWAASRGRGWAGIKEVSEQLHNILTGNWAISPLEKKVTRMPQNEETGLPHNYET
jgi:hypothetical protein